MPRFRVSWEIDIEAGDPVLAAKQALSIQRDPQSTATQFKAQMVGPCEKCGGQYVHNPGCTMPKRLRQPENMGRYVDYTFTVEAA